MVRIVVPCRTNAEIAQKKKLKLENQKKREQEQAVKEKEVFKNLYLQLNPEEQRTLSIPGTFVWLLQGSQLVINGTFPLDIFNLITAVLTNLPVERVRSIHNFAHAAHFNVMEQEINYRIANKNISFFSRVLGKNKNTMKEKEVDFLITATQNKTYIFN